MVASEGVYLKIGALKYINTPLVISCGISLWFSCKLLVIQWAIIFGTRKKGNVPVIGS